MEEAASRRRFARAAWVNVLGNAAKILVEGAVGLLFGSVALVADAAHSIADLIASLVVLLWGGSRFDDPDIDHPHGHARIEPLTALFVGAVIVLLGANLLYESVLGLVESPTITFSPYMIAALLFAMADMYLVYWYTERTNADIGSTALDALAVDCLNDLYTSVAALVGVAGIAFGYPVLDAVAGGVVSLLVVYQGISIARENLTYLSGKAAPGHRREDVRRTLLDHDEVHGVHDLAVFWDGSVLEVEAHVEVDGDLTLRQAHDLETRLVTSAQTLDDVRDVHIHLDPSGVGEWKDTQESLSTPAVTESNAGEFEFDARPPGPARPSEDRES
ncbi:cation diffusion facilitator family transporter [Halovenus sp. WSH3]|uniref:Cation diffusion facilitator family transporter n=1 Tax=Halovenus carboxidivorans TaxID=2692199 RepID=A0A6B0TA17_9EURY|nr:cation diffusion facilitator family transporter [Halovenus carboxidivorans]MXR52433.1 cation diffusion facilitator family transporter [Halovenus carboxidivorans]